MAHRLDITIAKLPKLTPKLATAMAAAGFHAGQLLTHNGIAKPKHFDDLPDEAKETWMAIVRAVYAEIAKDGGATAIEIPEQEP